MVLISLFSHAVLSQIAEEEIKSVPWGSVEFLNYEGPHDKIETREQIRAIGEILGTVTEGEKVTVYGDRYKILHLTDPDITTGFDADILIILEGAAVDHIDNIRRILSGYLEIRYGYQREDADLLAEFITYYNAVYRGNIDYFQKSYKDPVFEKLHKEKAGLSTRYMDWPGKTEILIPLTSRAADGGLGSLDTDELTEEEVIDKLREEEDLGLQERKEMIELKEREIEASQAELEEEKALLDEKEEDLADRGEVLEDEKRDIEEALEEAETPAEQKELEEQQQAIETEEKALAAEREKIEEERKRIGEEEATIAAREERVREERETIAEEDRELRTTTPPEKEQVGEQVLFLSTTIRNGSLFRRFIFVEDEKTVTDSPLNTIRSNIYISLGGSYIVIAGEEGGNKAVRLVSIDPATLEIESQGSDDVSPYGMLILSGNFIYTPVRVDGKWCLGKFDKSLTLLGKSEDQVAPYSWLTEKKGSIWYQGSDGSIGSIRTSDFQ